MERLNAELQQLLDRLPNVAAIRERLETLASIYPFNDYEFMMFYSNEHEPIHVHGKRQGRECKAELIVVDGKIVEIRLSAISGKRPLQSTELSDFEALVHTKTEDIVEKWISFFVRHQNVNTEVITQRVK